MKLVTAENEPLSTTHTQKKMLPPATSVSFLKLFRYATHSDLIILIISLVASAVEGSSIPLLFILFGDIADVFQLPEEEMLAEALTKFIQFIILGLVIFASSWVAFAGFTYTSERQLVQYRVHYLRAILNQEMAWFDNSNQNEINTRMTQQMHDIQGAIGEHLVHLMKNIGTALSGVLTGLVLGWQLSLVITAVLPLLFVTVYGITTSAIRRDESRAKEELETSTIAEQALNSIKTIKSLNGEDFECRRYESALEKTLRNLRSLHLCYAVSFGAMYIVQFCMYSLTCFYSSKLMIDETEISNGENYKSSKITTIFVSILFGIFTIGEIGPAYSLVNKGKLAAQKAFKVIDSTSQAIKAKRLSKPLNNFNGAIKFEDVSFAYPAKPDNMILDKLSLKIEPSKVTALVGQSGCGKSTVFQLIQQFYDPFEGQILLGDQNIDLTEVDPQELYKQIVVVSQEPVLFTGTIRENLTFGNSQIPQEEVLDVLKKVNAMEFISKLPQGLETQVGMGGSQLSGGQKQRIAIARSLLKKPKVLLLDEATSALDRKNEMQIQETLDQLAKEITTVVIAHRLTTIRQAHMIYFFDNGRVVESGSHDQLMSNKARYYSLFQAQLSSDHQEAEKDIKKLDTSIQRLPLGTQNELETNKLIQVTFQNSDKEIDPKPKGDLEALTTTQTQKLEYRRILEILGQNTPKNTNLLVIGILAAIINGCIFPFFSIAQSRIIAAQIEHDPQLYKSVPPIKNFHKEELENVAAEVSVEMIIVGAVYGFATLFELSFLSLFGESLCKSIRTKLIRKLLQLPMSYYDVSNHSLGAQVGNLNIDCNYIRQLFSVIIGHKTQSIAAICCGFTVAFIRSWRLTLIALGISPICFLIKKLSDRFYIVNPQATVSSLYKCPETISMEMVLNVKTVLALNNQEYLLRNYENQLTQATNRMRRLGIISGFASGVSMSQIYFVLGILFYCGTQLIYHGFLGIEDFYATLIALNFTILGGMKEIKFEYDAPKSILAVAKICDLLNLKDEHQLSANYLTNLKQNSIKELKNGRVQFLHVSFKYPNREAFVLQNLNLELESSTKVALVGYSGCGKSTIIALIMRLYDPVEGTILIDGIDIRLYDLRFLRSQIAVVSQEPVLFTGSILENIIYNQPGNDLERVYEVAKVAQAYQFIVESLNETDKSSTVQAFDRQVGTKGMQLSGGQKQRIAIARALFRESKIMLFDEATSALDAKTEEQVTIGIDKLANLRTRITIAHRICTIRDSDAIFVFENGRVIEKGNYKELIQNKAFFYNLEQGLLMKVED